MSRSTTFFSADRLLLGVVAIIVLIGLTTLASASGPVAHERFGDSTYLLHHQVIFGLIPGCIGAFVAFMLPMRFVHRLIVPAFLVSLVLLVLVFVPGIGAQIGTAHSWIRLPGLFTFQPSELLKLSLILFLAGWLKDRKEDGTLGRLSDGFLPFALILGLISLLLIKQPDVGTLSILIGVAMTIYFCAGAPLRYVGAFLASGFAMIGILIVQAPYRLARLTTFLHPELDPQGIGYHVNQALLAIGSGGWFGLGYGQSRQKFAYLPEVASDSIFAVFAEEMGWFLSFFFVALIFALVVHLLMRAKRSQDLFERLVLVGVAAWIGLQSCINIGAMVSILPITGVPLPLMSYGGTSLAILLTTLGFCARRDIGSTSRRV